MPMRNPSAVRQDDVHRGRNLQATGRLQEDGLDLPAVPRTPGMPRWTGPAGLLSCARDVDYYHCDVVGTAVALGEAREFGSGLLRAGGGLQNGADRRFADMGRQPVGTQQQPGAGEDGGQADVRFDRGGPADGAGEQVALRVVPPPILAYPAGLDEALADPVVAGPLLP